MTQKPIAIVIFLLVAAALIFVVLGMKKTESDTPAPVETQTSAQTQAVATTTSPSIAVGEGLPIYTLADVAKHASPEDCWTTVNGNVYDLTPFVGKHPGGKDILKVCGIDGTKLFMGQHGGQAKQENQLAGLEIGVLAK